MRNCKLTGAVYGRLNVNVALNRPTFMSSLFYSDVYGSYVSSRANDGDKDPRALRIDNSCMITETEVAPWWAVDLGTALVVVGVLFTNRAETKGRLTYSHSAISNRRKQCFIQTSLRGEFPPPKKMKISPRRRRGKI